MGVQDLGIIVVIGPDVMLHIVVFVVKRASLC